MKKTIFILSVVVSVLMMSCEGNTKTEDVGVGTSAATEALEKLSEIDQNVDTTTAFCNCPHKCKTQEECAKNCDDKCEKK